MTLKSKLFCFLIVAFSCTVQAQYKIKGTINLHEEYGSTVYLSYVDNLTNLYYVSRDHIINKTKVDSLGNFEMSGLDLPEENRIYRLYLSREDNKAYLIRSGDNENFIHLVLNNSSDIKITTSKTGPRVFQDYEVTNSPISSEVKNFYTLFNKLEKMMDSEINSKSKNDYIYNKYNTSILKFVKNTAYPIVSLIAISHINFKYLSEEIQLQMIAFLKKLESDVETDYYKTSYEKYLEYSDIPIYESQSYISENSLIIALILLLGLFLIIIVYLTITLQSKNKLLLSGKKLELLSKKEIEVLHLLCEENSYKEIANQLHIEVTTVKSHTHSIYKKLKINTRKEAQQFVKKALIQFK